MQETDWDRVIQKLEEQTKAGQLVWQRDSRIALMPPDRTVIGHAFIAVVVGKLIRVYEFSYQGYDANFDLPVVSRTVCVEFIDADGKSLWEFPPSSYRFSLIDAIRAQLAGANDFLTVYLKAS